MPFFIPLKMGMLDQVREDIKDITSNPDGFSAFIKMDAPGGQKISFYGLHKKIRLAVDPDTGKAINSMTASISVCESILTAQNYPVRNERREVDLQNHIVTVKDSTGLECKYMVAQNIPDETVGIIVCMLSNYE
jgi:hypothetical protein